MAKYLGPYDEFRPDGPEGKVYHPGDNVPISKKRRDELGSRYRWDDSEPEEIIPVMADLDQIQTPQNPSPPPESQKK
jgi:hypothetical protein